MSRHREDIPLDPATMEYLADVFMAMGRANPRDPALCGLVVAAEHALFLARSQGEMHRGEDEREVVHLSEAWKPERRAG